MAWKQYRLQAGEKIFRGRKNAFVDRMYIGKNGRYGKMGGVGGGDGLKKIPTLYERVYKKGQRVGLTSAVRDGFEWVERGDGEATEKVDGSACAIINGALYRRYDAKADRVAPPGAIPCQPFPDPVTGHWPHWVAVDFESRQDRWYAAAYENTPWCREDGTYEAVGRHFQGNPYGLDADYLERHGRIKLPDFPRTFFEMQEYLRTHEIEGVVFWKDGEPKCKIKRTDFGFEWPVKDGGNG